MGLFVSKLNTVQPVNTVTCSLCYNTIDDDTQTIIEACKHKLCESCNHSYNYKKDKVLFCPLCGNN